MRIYALKRKIRRNPYLGIRDSEGTYLYSQGRDTIKYEILNMDESQGKKPPVKIISIKSRLTESEIARMRTKKIFTNFFRYRTWIYLFRPPIVLSLILGMSILYFGIIEPYETKVNRFKWIIAKVIGVEPDKIEYRGGLFEIFGKRRIAYKNDIEYVSLAFNPLNIFSSKEIGYVTRWNKDTGYITNPISYDGGGNVWIKYKDTWEHGIISKDEVKWDNPQGTANWKIFGHEISTKDKDLRIIDQKIP